MRRGARSIRTAPPSSSRGPARSDDPRRLLRRRLHADLSGADVPGRRLPPILPTATAWTSTSQAFDRAVASAAPMLDQPASARVRRRDLRRVHASHHRADGRRRADGSTRARARSTTSGRPASTSSCTTMWRPRFARSQRAGVRIGLISNSHRCLASFQSHFELDGSDRRRRLFVGARPDEAAPEHFPRGAAISWTCRPAKRSWSATASVRTSKARWRPGCARSCCTAVPRRTRAQTSLPRAAVPIVQTLAELPEFVGSVSHVVSAFRRTCF